MTKSPTNDECPVVEESEVALASIERPDLLTVADAKALSVARMTDLFKTQINPGQLQFMKLLGVHKVKIDRAEGMYYYGHDGRRILDFFGGFGSLALGHNHPRIFAARNKFQDERRHEIAIAYMSQYAAVLAHNLAACSPTTSAWCSSAPRVLRPWKLR